MSTDMAASACQDTLNICCQSHHSAASNADFLDGSSSEEYEDDFVCSDFSSNDDTSDDQP